MSVFVHKFLDWYIKIDTRLIKHTFSDMEEPYRGQQLEILYIIRKLENSFTAGIRALKSHKNTMYKPQKHYVQATKTLGTVKLETFCCCCFSPSGFLQLL